MPTYLRKHGPGFNQNAQLTLFRTVQISHFAHKIAQPLLATAVRRYTDPVNLWDFQTQLNQVLMPDDEVFILLPIGFFHLRLVQMFEDRLGEIGDLVGWHRLFRSPWRNPSVVDVLDDRLVAPKDLLDASLHLGTDEDANFLRVRR
jgi:hypothetical protein